MNPEEVIPQPLPQAPPVAQTPPSTSTAPVLQKGLPEKTKTIITVVLLLLMFVNPIPGLAGVILMWRWMKWKTYRKILTTLVFLFSGFILIIIAASIFIVTYTPPQ